ncbi:MAG: phosphatidate cytidylyltransferase [Thermoleophilaceae bacterium]|jgi:phosphatidate cytidylyltransferase
MTVSRRNEGSDLGARVLAAVPAIAFAIFIVVQGGTVFAVGVALLGVMACAELFRMMRQPGPPVVAGYLAVIAMVMAARFGDREQVLLVVAVSVPVTFFFTLVRPQRENASWAMAVVFMAVCWIGLAVAHATLLRKLPHGGGLMLDTLIGTFLGDTGAYFGGRMWGRRKMSPRISPNKTLEGLLAGIVVGTFAFWFAGTYQDWLNGIDALIIGAAVAVAAPIGDLFESLIKRDNAVKDTGRVFGAHGGVLDRLDAVFFTVVTAYYVALAVL